MALEEILVIDIETVPNERADDYVKSLDYAPDSNLSSLDSPPATITNLKDPDLRATRLAEWTANQKIKLEQSVARKRQSAYDQCSLKWWTGKIILIAGHDLLTGKTYVWEGIHDELALLDGFGKDLTSIYPGHMLSSKQGEDFDFPFLVGRLMAHDLGIPRHLRKGYPISDVNDIFSRSRQCGQRGTLADYAFGLGLPGKTGKGSDVAFLWQSACLGDHASKETLIAYAKRDVEIAGEMLRRYQKNFLPAEPQMVRGSELNVPF